MAEADTLRLWESFAGRSAEEVRARVAGSADASLGEANAAVLRTRRALFGPEMTLLAECPSCGEWAEFAAPAALFEEAPPMASGEFSYAGETVRYRLPTLWDLRDRPSADALRARCLLSDGHAPETLAAWEAHLDEVDPLAVVAFGLTCAACGEGWEGTFDPAAEWPRELDRAARILLTDVAELARHYGWTEGEILSLSPARRRVYLELAGGQA